MSRSTSPGILFGSMSSVLNTLSREVEDTEERKGQAR